MQNTVGVKRTNSYEKYVLPGAKRTGSKVDEEQERSEENQRQGGRQACQEWREQIAGGRYVEQEKREK
jgi:hypothetical protein